MNGSFCHEGVFGSSFTTWRFTRQSRFCRQLLRESPTFLLRTGPRPGAHFSLCAKRQKGRLERTAESRAHGSIPAAAAGRPDRDDTATELEPVGAGALDGRNWSPEAQNGHAGCQKGRLDGCTDSTESDTSEQDNTMRSHGIILHFQIDFTGFANGAAPPKTVP